MNERINFGNSVIMGDVHGGTINFGNSPTDFDYDKVINLLSEIHKFSSSPEFRDVFPKEDDKAKKIITETLDSAKSRTKSDVIRSGIKTLGDLAIGTSGSLIATGIIELVKKLLSC